MTIYGLDLGTHEIVRMREIWNTHDIFMPNLPPCRSCCVRDVI